MPSSADVHRFPRDIHATDLDASPPRGARDRRPCRRRSSCRHRSVPSNPTTSPGPISRLTPSTTRRPPYALTRPVTSRRRRGAGASRPRWATDQNRLSHRSRPAWRQRLRSERTRNLHARIVPIWRSHGQLQKNAIFEASFLVLSIDSYDRDRSMQARTSALPW